MAGKRRLSLRHKIYQVAMLTYLLSIIFIPSNFPATLIAPANALDALGSRNFFVHANFFLVTLFDEAYTDGFRQITGEEFTLSKIRSLAGCSPSDGFCFARIARHLHCYREGGACEFVALLKPINRREYS